MSGACRKYKTIIEMIDRKTQSELRSKYNPEGSDLRNAQLRMLEILKYIDRVCRDNNLTYWLSSGTLLGAVRHQGFIPWDDDLDIEMPIKDYRRFKNILKKEHGQFVLQDHESDRNYYYAYPKVRDTHSLCINEMEVDDKYFNYKGLWVDIFVLEENPRWLQILSWYLYSYGRRIITCNHSRFLHIIADIRHYICIYIIFPLIRIIAMFCRPSYFTKILGSEYPSIRRKEYMKESIELKFEDGYFFVPKGYEGVLNDMYSFDYRQLPPEHLRSGHYMKFKYIQ